MTQLATREQVNGGGTHAATQRSNMFGIAEVWELAEQLHKSKLFPNITSPHAAFTLMMICQADGLHPMQVLRIYDIIDGKPAMKSAAIQAKFQESGGTVEILKCDANEARAIFSHPRFQPKPIELSFTIQDAAKAKLTGKKNWMENPADMLWWRLVSKSIRKINPGIVAGIYSVEEVQDMGPGPERPNLEPATRAKLDAPNPAPVAANDPPVVGYAGMGFDGRTYLRVAGDAVEAVNADMREKWAGVAEAPLVSLNDLHKHVFNTAIQLGYAEGPMPAKLTPAMKVLDQVYKEHRAWVRETLTDYLSEHVQGAAFALDEARAAKEPEPAAEEMTDAEAAQEFGPGANG